MFVAALFASAARVGWARTVCQQAWHTPHGQHGAGPRGQRGWRLAPAGAVVAAMVAGLGLSACGDKAAEAPSASSASASGGQSAPAAGASAPAGGSAPSLSVQATTAQAAAWDVRVVANGPIQAWQEAIVGAELGGQRLTDVRVDVGDVVRKGQVLASFNREAVQADEQAARAALAEAEALAAEAHANAERTRRLQGTGALSPQDAQRSLTAEATAQARLGSARAQLNNQSLRLRQTQVVAPDDGVITARQATVGAVGQPGQELFRMVRQSRLQWRAEMAAADLPRVQVGQAARVKVPGVAEPIEGRVRVVSPTVDNNTRNGVVHVDLPAQAMRLGVRPGMFATGWLAQGQSKGLTLPQTAVALQDGFSYVFVLEGNKVRRAKVQVGRHEGDRVEILSGLPEQARVVAAGVGLLTDGDTVRVVGNAP